MPAVYLVSNSNGLNLNVFEYFRVTSANAYAFHLEETSGTGYSFDNVFRNGNFEICNGGGIRLYSACNVLLENLQFYDLALYNSGLVSNDLIVVGSNGGTPSQYVTIRNCGRRGATTFGSGIVDIRLQSPSKAHETLIESSDIGTLNTGYVIDCGSNVVTLINVGPWVTLQNASNAVNLTGPLTYSQISDLSSWAGSTAITTLGTIATGTVPGANVSGNIAGNAANVTGTVAYSHGGTGLTTLGSADQILGVNDAGTALQWTPFTVAASGVATVNVTSNATPLLVNCTGITSGNHGYGFQCFLGPTAYNGGLQVNIGGFVSSTAGNRAGFINAADSGANRVLWLNSNNGTSYAPSYSVGAYNTFSTTQTLSTIHRTVMVSAGSGWVLSLPASSTTPVGWEYIIKKTDNNSNAITVTPNGTDKIDGASTYVLNAQYMYIHLANDGAGNWWITASGTA